MLRVGIVGGGQLGQMMILAGVPLGFEFGVLSDTPEDPAARLAAFHVPGSLQDAEAIVRLTEWADVTTYEIEHINVDALDRAGDREAVLHPAPRALRLINDKMQQKLTLADHGVPVPSVLSEPTAFPVVQKARRGGYDGRGVAVLRSPHDPGLEGAVFYEEAVDIAMEVAVIVARRSNGEMMSYGAVEMEFDPRLNICTRVVAPARATPGVLHRCSEIAEAAVAAIGGTGVTAVELFVTHDDAVLVNELAPRPHNSGHLTIEANATSQFEQHLRCIAGLPFGSTTLLRPAAMLNLLGAPGAVGTPAVESVVERLSAPGVHVHWYGKANVRPGRKMGHVTVTAATREEAIRIADEIEPATKVEAEE